MTPSLQQILEEFDKLAQYGDEVNTTIERSKLKSFLKQSCLAYAESVVPERIQWTEELMEETIDTESYIEGHSFCRSQILSKLEEDSNLTTPTGE